MSVQCAPTNLLCRYTNKTQSSPSLALSSPRTRLYLQPSHEPYSKGHSPIQTLPNPTPNIRLHTYHYLHLSAVSAFFRTDQYPIQTLPNPTPNIRLHTYHYLHLSTVSAFFRKDHYHIQSQPNSTPDPRLHTYHHLRSFPFSILRHRQLLPGLRTEIHQQACPEGSH